MRKNIYYLLIFLSMMSYGQGRVGINTTNPEVTLDIKEVPISEMPEGTPQGVSFPNFTTQERNKFKNVKEGTMIFNTDKKSLEIYTSLGNVQGWYRMGVIENEPIPSTRMITKSDIADKQKIMFQDDESESVLFNEQERGFYLNAMLQVKKIDENKFKVRNFLPHTFENVEVYFKNSNISKPLKVAVIEELASLAEMEIDLPFENEKVRLEGNSKEYDVSTLKTNDYTLSVDVPDDRLFNKIKTIKHNTFISFGKYGTGNWGATTARHIRLYLPTIANMAYLYSHPKFKDKFINFKHRLYDNNKKDIDREAVYNKIFTIQKQHFGVTTGVEGLGGGGVFGIHERFLANDDYYSQLSHWPLECWAHEFGHELGYSHASNMTYKDGTTKTGYVDIVIRLFGDLIRVGDLPFWKNPYKSN